MSQDTTTPYQAFTQHLAASLADLRPARLHVLTDAHRLKDDEHVTAAMKIRQADEILISMLAQIEPQQREERDGNNNRFCFTYIPNRVEWAVRDKTVRTGSLGALYMHASKPDGQTDAMLVEKGINPVRYRGISHSQVLQPSRVSQKVIRAWRYGGSPPSFGSPLSGLINNLSQRQEKTLAKHQYETGPADKMRVARLFKASLHDDVFRGEGVPVGGLAQSSFYEELGFDALTARAHATAFEQAQAQTMQNMNAYAYATRRTRLAELGMPLSSLPAYVSDRMLNYLVSAPNATVAGYRWDAFAIMRDKVFPGEAGVDMAKAPNQSLMMAVENAFCPGPSVTMPHQVGKAIDEGVFPAKLLAQACGFTALSKRQFDLACAMYGRYHYIGHSDAESLVPASLSSAMGMAKIPKDWLVYDADVGSVHPGFYREKRNFDHVTAKVMGCVKSFLVATGQEMDRLSSAGDKTGVKALSRQWRWLTAGQSSLEQKVSAFNNQYDVVASYDDYRKIIEQLMLSVTLRMIDECDDINLEDVLRIDEYDDDAIDLDVSGVQTKLFDAIDKENAAMDNSFEDEDGEIVYEEPEPVADYMEPLVRVGLPPLTSLCPDIQTILQKNQLLHKEYNDLLTLANRNTTLDVHWGTPLGETNTVRVGLYDVTCIHSRLDLLDEGHKMAHCVFSYLQPLAQGEAVVFSVRDPEQQSRLATVMFNVGVNDEGEPELAFDQCFGPFNSVNAIVEDIDITMRQWMDDINNKKVSFDMAAIVDGIDENASALDMSSVRQHAALLQAVPYSEDGAYMAYFSLPRYLPGSLTVMEVLSQVSPTWEELFSRSGMKEDVSQIMALSSQYQVSPIGVITAKQTLPSVHRFDAAPLAAHLEALTPLVQLIQAQVKPGQTRAQREQSVGQALADNFDSPLVITAEISKLLGRPEPDAMAVAALLANGKPPVPAMQQTLSGPALQARKRA